MSGIDNLVSHIENNQSQKDGTISGAEWQLVAKVFGAPALKEGETFSKKDIKKLDKEEQQQAKEHNAKEKENKEDNNSLKKAQEVLNNPEHVKQLLHMCEVQAKLIKNGADVVYYESFLNSIPVGGLKDDDTVKRIQNLLDEKGKVSASKESSSIVEPSNDTGNTSESLQKKLEKVDSYDLGLFKSTIESLQSGKISIDQLDPLNEITQIIKEIAQLDPAIALKQIDTFLDNKISSLSEPLKTEFKKKVQEFHPLLESLLQRKDILQKFADIVDNNIKGLSYQSLLETAKDKNTLNSPEAKKAINNLFHIDEKLFDQLIRDFNDPQKKEQVGSIIKEYITLSDPSIPLEGTSFVVKDIFLNDGKIKKSSFVLLDKEKKEINIKVNGKDELVAPYFGAKDNGNALTLKECVDNTLRFSDALGVQNGSISMNPELTGLMKQTIDTKAGPKSLSELANSLLDNPLLKELRKLLLMFNSEVSGDGKAAVQLNYLNAVDAMKNTREKEKTQYPNYAGKDSKWLGEQIKKYPFSLKDDPTDDVAKLSQDAPGSEKHFFASVLTPEEQIAYILDPVERNKYKEGGNIQKIKLTDFIESNGAVQNRDKPTNTITGDNSQETKSIEQPTQGKEFKDGVLYPELSIDGKSPGKVELKGKDTDTPYLIVDGQAIALTASADPTIKEGILFVKDGAKNAFVQTTIKIDKNNDLSVDTGKNSIALDSYGNSNLANVYDKNVLKFPILSGNKNIFEYFAFAKSVITTKPNKIDAVYNTIPENDVAAREEFEKTITSIQEKISFLKQNELSSQNIQKIILDAKVGDICLSNDNQEPQFKLAIKDWLSMFGIENTDKESA